ncbi:MAG: hypothetical protein AAB797_02705 [Patescibacteria group bacterium]
MENNNTTNHSELEAIKNEITTKLGEQNKSLPWNNIVVTVILGALTLVSLAQMMASVKIFNKLKTGEVKASSGAPQTNSVQNLPDMVGGC